MIDITYFVDGSNATLKNSDYVRNVELPQRVSQLPADSSSSEESVKPVQNRSRRRSRNYQSPKSAFSPTGKGSSVPTMPASYGLGKGYGTVIVSFVFPM